MPSRSIMVGRLLTVLVSLASVSAFVMTKPLTRGPSLKHQRDRRHTQTKRRKTSRNKGPSTHIYAASLPDLARDYQYLVSSYPLVTQSATYGMFCGIGDVAAQSTNNKRNDAEVYDLKRSLRFVVKGLGSGIIWSAWYHLADTWASSLTQDTISILGTGDEVIVRTAVCVLLEQFVACPVVYSLWDIPVPSLLRGDPLRSIPKSVQTKVPGLLLDNAKVWTFANVVVYNIPLEWRVFAMSCAQIFWASVVSSVASRKVSKLQ